MDLAFFAPDVDQLASCDVVFFATPHGVAQSMVADILARGVKVIDLSADFRIRDADLWESWYGQPHSARDLIPQAVYGLPEVNREAIKACQPYCLSGLLSHQCSAWIFATAGS